jgi:RNA-binding protein Musashi
MSYHTQQPFYVHYANQIPVHNQWYNQSCSNNNSYGANRYRGSDPNKVFVGGLRGHITTEDLKNYFEKFGTITDVVVMREPFTQRPRGFGFITFDSEKAMAKVLENSFHNLNGTRVETKMAIPKDHTYGQDRRQHSPMIWRGNSYHMGYGGLYPPHNMQYIVNNHYMVPFQQYMYSPHTPDYGYMANGSVSSNVAASQGTPVYIGHGTHFGYDSLDTDHLDAYGGDSKLNQSMPDEQLLDIQAANISKEQPLNLDSKNIHVSV